MKKAKEIKWTKDRNFGTLILDNGNIVIININWLSSRPYQGLHITTNKGLCDTTPFDFATEYSLGKYLDKLNGTK